MSEEKSKELIPNPKHLAKLKEGVDVWNEWCKEQRNLDTNFHANLQGALFQGFNIQDVDFQGANLIGVQFQGADLIGAQLQDANLTYANLNGANLNGASLREAQIQDADLNDAQFQGADLNSANFRYARLERAQFQGANLTYARFGDTRLSNINFIDAKLKGASFRNAKLKGAKFNRADLEGADLEMTDLEGANFNRANLKGAKLRSTNLIRAKNIRFDNQDIKAINISSRTTGPWLVLKRQYSNTMLLFTLAPILMFFIPYVFNIIVWRTVNIAQELTVETQNTTKLIADQLLEEGHSLAGVSQLLNERVSNIKPCLAKECRTWKIGEILIGLHQGYNFVALSLLLLFYNAGRLFLTLRVGRLKDEEQQTSLTPYTFEYMNLYRIHRVISFIGFIAILWGGVQASRWLNESVYLPI